MISSRSSSLQERNKHAKMKELAQRKRRFLRVQRYPRVKRKEKELKRRKKTLRFKITLGMSRGLRTITRIVKRLSSKNLRMWLMLKVWMTRSSFRCFPNVLFKELLPLKRTQNSPFLFKSDKIFKELIKVFKISKIIQNKKARKKSLMYFCRLF